MSKNTTFKTEDVVNASLALSRMYGFRKVNDFPSTKDLVRIALAPENDAESRFSLLVANEISNIDEISDGEFEKIKDNFNHLAITSSWGNSVKEKLEKPTTTLKDFGFVCSSVVKSEALQRYTEKISKTSEFIDATAIVVNFDNLNTRLLMHIPMISSSTIFSGYFSSVLMEKFTNGLSIPNFGEMIKIDGYMTSNILSNIIIADFYVANDYTYSNEFVKSIYEQPPF